MAKRIEDWHIFTVDHEEWERYKARDQLAQITRDTKEMAKRAHDSSEIAGSIPPAMVDMECRHKEALEAEHERNQALEWEVEAMNEAIKKLRTANRQSERLIWLKAAEVLENALARSDYDMFKRLYEAAFGTGREKTERLIFSDDKEAYEYAMARRIAYAGYARPFSDISGIFGAAVLDGREDIYTRIYAIIKLGELKKGVHILYPLADNNIEAEKVIRHAAKAMLSAFTFSERITSLEETPITGERLNQKRIVHTLLALALDAKAFGGNRMLAYDAFTTIYNKYASRGSRCGSIFLQSALHHLWECMHQKDQQSPRLVWELNLFIVGLAVRGFEIDPLLSRMIEQAEAGLASASAAICILSYIPRYTAKCIWALGTIALCSEDAAASAMAWRELERRGSDAEAHLTKLIFEILDVPANIAIRARVEDELYGLINLKASISDIENATIRRIVAALSGIIDDPMIVRELTWAAGDPDQGVRVLTSNSLVRIGKIVGMNAPTADQAPEAGRAQRIRRFNDQIVAMVTCPASDTQRHNGRVMLDRIRGNHSEKDLLLPDTIKPPRQRAMPGRATISTR